MKNITLVVCGGLAATKSYDLYCQLKQDFSVKIIVTKNAEHFVDEKLMAVSEPTLFYKDKFTKDDGSPHIELEKWTDLYVIYPATFNFIGKVASGFADDYASLIMTNAKKPVFFYEAMHHNMLENKIYIDNKKKLALNNNYFIKNAIFGPLGDGDLGKGRIKEPKEVKREVDDFFIEFKNLLDKNIFINLGRTRAYIDSVRYITNGSSGETGVNLFNAAFMFTKNYKVFYGDNDYGLVQIPNFTYCKTNAEMLANIKKCFDQCDIFIASAALNDFGVKEIASSKIRKVNNNNLQLNLVKEVDVLLELGKLKTHQFLVGFCLLDNLDITVAKEKMKEKNLDMIVLNTTSTLDSNIISAYILNCFNDDIKKLENIAKSHFSIELYREINIYFKK